MAGHDQTPVLNLNTAPIATRPIVTIDGARYELRHPDEFPYLVYRNQAGTWEKAHALVKQLRGGGQWSDADEAEFSALLAPLTRSLLLAPEAVQAKLTPEMQYAIVLSFFGLLLDRRAAVAAAAGSLARTVRPSTRRGGGRSPRKTRRR